MMRNRSKKSDLIFAWIYLVVGYLWVYVFSSWNFSRNIAWFTVLYVVVVLVYMETGEKQAQKTEKKNHMRERVFWTVVTLAIGISYAFWTVMPLLQTMVLMMTAAYWTLSVSGRLLQSHRTSEWVACDVWNALIIVPFSNFTCQFRILLGKKIEKTETEKERETRETAGKIAGAESTDNEVRETAKSEDSVKQSNLSGVICGIVIAIPLLCIILPLLSSADEGFQMMFSNLGRFVTEHFGVFLLRLVFAIPVSMYLFGLAYGGKTGRGTQSMQPESMRQSMNEMRVLPDTSVAVAGGIICFVYVVFILLQAKYFLSAFTGVLPESFTYAEYARRGFFELCTIAALNLGILTASGAFAKTERKNNRGLRILNVALSVLTLLLLATAASKMALYVSAYGLTVKRVLTLVFMIWLALVFAGIIARQWKTFALIRSSVLAGTVMYTLLCVFPVEMWINTYNNMMGFGLLP